jgi:hypothetical protein
MKEVKPINSIKASNKQTGAGKRKSAAEKELPTQEASKHF